MKVGIVLSVVLWVALFGVAIATSGCGLAIPQLTAGQRFIVELDQASAITNNDDEDVAASRRERRLRGS